MPTARHPEAQDGGPITDHTLHTKDTTPEESRPLLEASQAAFGQVPNLHAVMAEAPGLLRAYQTAHEAVAQSSLDADEVTVLWQSINVEHAYHYYVPAHSGIARSMKVDPALDDALRAEAPLPTDRLEALRTFTLAVAQKVMSNYTNAIAKTPVDAELEKFRLQKASRDAA